MRQIVWTVICSLWVLGVSAQEKKGLTLTVSDEQYKELNDYFAQQQKKQRKTIDWAQFDRYAKANQELRVRPKVVFMGNSITDNWAKMRPDFFEKNHFAGRGISGQTSSQMLVRFQQDVILLKPRAVVINAGTNDIAQNNGRISLDHVLLNIISMCELAKAHHIRPILSSVLPANRFGWNKELTPADDVIALNKLIKEYARENRITYLDYYSALVDESKGLPAKYSKDGVHPTLEGYAVMEPLALEAIGR